MFRMLGLNLVSGIGRDSILNHAYLCITPCMNGKPRGDHVKMGYPPDEIAIWILILVPGDFDETDQIKY